MRKSKTGNNGFNKSLNRSTSILALGVSLVAGGAIAQDAKPVEATGEVVVITGFRASLQTAVAKKKVSEQIVESINAEDIGKLPDASIAESIARLPGLTSQRLSGRSQLISIRGFAPDLSSTLLNGREQVTTGDNRAVEFDQFPSEIMNQVLVYKSPMASVVGQGLSGTVDLRTIRPLQYGKKVLAVGGRIEQSSLGALNAGTDEYGYRGNLTYVDQFMDGKLGVAFAAGYTKSPYQIEEFNAWGYAGVGTNTYAIGGSKSYVSSTTLERTGVMGTIEYKVNDNFTTTVDAYYSDFQDHQIKRGIEMPLVWGSSLQSGYTTKDVTLSTGQTVKIVDKGTFTNVKGVIRNDANEKNAELFSFGWNNVYKNDNGLKLTADLSYSRVDREELVLETYAGTGRSGSGATDTVGFQMTEHGAVFTHSLDYSNPALIFLTSPQGWGGDITNTAGGQNIRGGQDGYYNNRIVEDEIKQVRLELEKTFETGFIKGIIAGVNLTSREKSLTPDEYFLGLKANTTGAINVAIPSNALLAPTNLGYLGLGKMVSYDPVALLNSGVYNLVKNPNSDVLTKGWTISEEIITPYLQANIRGELGAAELSGNFGIQFAMAEQSSTGFVAQGSPIIRSAEVTRGTDYVDWLPSLNLTLRYPNEYYVRFAASRQIARPRLDDLAVSAGYGFNADLIAAGISPFSGGGGNPYLEPYRATAFDLSLEKYFGRKGYVALQIFHKDLDSYIYRGDIPYNFEGFPTPNPILDSTSKVWTTSQLNYNGFFNVPLNGEGGSLYGWELAATLPFDVFAEALDGFGVTGGVSRTFTKVQPSPGAPSEDMPGYSEWVYNLTAFYEKDGFNARLSGRKRSSFIGELSGFGGNRTRRRAAPETIIDAQIGYEFGAGPLQGLSINLQGQNLTDERFATFDPVGGSSAPIDYQIYGKRYSLSFNFKF